MINQIRIFKRKYRPRGIGGPLTARNNMSDVAEEASRFVKENNAENAHFEVDYENEAIIVTYSIPVSDSDRASFASALMNEYLNGSISDSAFVSLVNAFNPLDTE